jgi:hypothetical protein
MTSLLHETARHRRRHLQQVLLLMSCCIAASAIPAASSSTDMTRLDEAVVTGKFPVHELRTQARDAQQRFFDRYNELNDLDEYDVICRIEAPIGSRLTQRSCKAVFEEAAIQDWAVEAFKIRQFVHSFNGGNPPYMPALPAPAFAAVSALHPTFQQRMREVVRDQPELLQLLGEWGDAVGRYELAQGGRDTEASPWVALTAADCDVARYCAATGTLRMSSDGHAYIGVLRLDDGSCINVSLPEDRSWDLYGETPRRMSVAGRSLAFPQVEGGSGFSVSGRPVGYGTCGWFLFVK